MVTLAAINFGPCRYWIAHVTANERDKQISKEKIAMVLQSTDGSTGLSPAQDMVNLFFETPGL
jgi:hypothetical protein